MLPAIIARRHISRCLQVSEQYPQQVVRRILGCCRRQDVVARMGSDEFMLVLPGLTEGMEPLPGNVSQPLISCHGEKKETSF